MAAADSTRTVVNVAASMSLGAKAKRHSSELAAKQSIAAAVSIRVLGGNPCVLAGAGFRCMIDRQAVAAPGTQRCWMCSAIPGSIIPNTDKNEEFILDSHGRPRK